MSTHPNTMLLLLLTPDDLSRKTMREILEATGAGEEETIKIGELDYNYIIFEEAYNESYQISGKEGDLGFFDFVTYGYGETISWDKLESHKNELEAWAKAVCAKHKCSYKIVVTANYW